MTLADLSKELGLRSRQFHERQQREQEAEKLRQRTASLKAYTDRACDARAKCSALESEGFAPNELPRAPLGLLQAYESPKDGQTKPAYLQKDWDAFSKAMKTYTEGLETATSNSTEAARSSLLGQMSVGEIRTYGVDPQAQRETDAAARELERLSSRRWPGSTEQELKALLREARELGNRYQAILVTGASEPLRRFLVEAKSANGAALEGLTAVRKELEDRGLLSRLRLVFR